MNEIVREWIAKAEADFHTASREVAVSEAANYDAVCFHAQQCIEKLMKAVLISRDVQPPRTHDLVRLNELVCAAVQGWSWPATDLRLLDRAAVEFRYPGESADLDEAEEALSVASSLRGKLADLLS